MAAVVRSTISTSLALVSAGLMSVTQVAPPLQQGESRVVEAAVTLAAAVTNSQACSGYHTDGCDIMARPVYQPVAIDPAGSAANIPLNLLNGVVGIPRAFVDAINELSYAMEVTGNWWVYTPTNVLGFDPADPPKMSALADLFIPFKPLSHAVGDQLSWWARANLPMNAGCTGSVGPVCPDLNAILSVMFKAPVWTLAGGYQFPKLFNPISDAEGELGDEIPGSVGKEVPWSEEYVKLNPTDWVNSTINFLQADPATNAPKPITVPELSATFDRLGKGLVLDFNPFVPRSFLLKGWPYTVLTPLFLPFVPLLCKTCNPDNPGGPPLNPATGAATTAAPSAAAASDAPDADAALDAPDADAAGRGNQAPAAAVVAAAKGSAEAAGGRETAAAPAKATRRGHRGAPAGSAAATDGAGRGHRGQAASAAATAAD